MTLSKNEWITLVAGIIVIFALALLILKPFGTTSTMQKTAGNGSLVSVHYTGMLENGTTFDSSYDRGEPLQFRLGESRVIKGWEEGILGMKVGEKKRLTIPPEKAYGATGVKNPQTGAYVIPPNATLIFDVELVDVQ